MNKDDNFQFDPPLFAKTTEASRLFGLSRTTLYRLRKEYPDFDALTIKVGRDVLFDVPKTYEWFGKHMRFEGE